MDKCKRVLLVEGEDNGWVRINDMYRPCQSSTSHQGGAMLEHDSPKSWKGR